jgi:hypothetical protein
MASYIYNLADTWNAAGTTFTAIKMNVTDTASAAGSLLMDLQVGGSSRCRISKTGGLVLTGVTTNDTASFSSNGITTATNAVGLTFSVGESFVANGTAVQVGALGSFSWRSTNRIDSGTADVILFRDGAAGTLAQRNGTNAQAFRWYRTFTDASNYERGALQTASGQIILAAETAGTGDDNLDVTLTPTGTGRVRFGTHAALSGETVTGYIEIKDAGGTVRKVAVVS